MLAYLTSLSRSIDGATKPTLMPTQGSRVHARLCDCSCKQTAVLIIRDADAAVALNGAAA